MSKKAISPKLDSKYILIVGHTMHAARTELDRIQCELTSPIRLRHHYWLALQNGTMYRALNGGVPYTEHHLYGLVVDSVVWAGDKSKIHPKIARAVKLALDRGKERRARDE